MATVRVDAQQSEILEHEGKILSKEEAVFIEIQGLHEKSRTVAPTNKRDRINRLSAAERDSNAASYTPKIVAIGPYQNKNPPKAGEDIKHHFVQLVLGQKLNEQKQNIIKEMSSLIEKARECYEESTEAISDYKFLKMMLFDSCFIVEIIRRFYGEEEVHDDDPMFIYEGSLSTIWRDLVLFDNQLPFFVLQRYYDLTLRPQSGRETKSGTLSFCKMALPFIVYPIGGPYCRLPGEDNHKPKHLLGLLYDCLGPIPVRWSTFGLSNQVMGHSHLFPRGGSLRILLMVLFPPCLIFLIFKTLLFSFCRSYSPSGNQLMPIRCSTRLLEKGVKFRKRGENWTSLFDVVFEDGTLTMPTLTISDNTNSVILNLLAYERYSQPGDRKYVADYMVLMDCLIDSPDDVKILCNHGILEVSSGDSDKITKLFDRPKDDFIIVDPYNFIYRETF
ncbi:Protein of unknown function DUF247, plant [Dillenia turbinata]|uniref:Uncharacterized protein n=1 Tax=Dillenia turbinata TaxID=194707 RepID=A0AAN8UEY4_9MAGN